MSNTNFGFFDSLSGDRVYDAEDFRKFANVIVKDGLNYKDNDATSFEVYASQPASMMLNIKPGSAIIKGAWISDKYNNTVTIESAPETYSRYDAVVLQFSTSSRNVTFSVVHGTQSDDPAYPEITQTDSLYQFVLAWVHVQAGVTAIEAEDITDARGSNYCPWMTTTEIQYLLEHILVTHTKDSQVGSPTRGTYVDADGNVQRTAYEVKQTVLDEFGTIIYQDTFPKATGGQLGGVIVGDGLVVDANGRISTTGGGGGGGGEYDEERLERCEMNILALYFALELETQADIQGMADNFIVETFDGQPSAGNYFIIQGMYDSTNHRLYA